MDITPAVGCGRDEGPVGPEAFTPSLDASVGQDLVRRLPESESRLPVRPPLADWSAGTPAAFARDLTREWATEFDLDTYRAELQALPHIRISIDGARTHFLHARSPGLHDPLGEEDPAHPADALLDHELSRLVRAALLRARPAARPSSFVDAPLCPRLLVRVRGRDRRRPTRVPGASAISPAPLDRPPSRRPFHGDRGAGPACR